MHLAEDDGVYFEYTHVKLSGFLWSVFIPFPVKFLVYELKFNINLYQRQVGSGPGRQTYVDK